MIRIRKAHAEAIVAHAERSYPHECCGFLLGAAPGSVKQVREVRGASNARDDSPANRYRIDPDEMFRVQRASQERGDEILGFYHSHPDVEARPSDYDRRHAWPWYSYVIVPVIRGGAGSPLAWVLDDRESRFAEETLEVVE